MATAVWNGVVLAESDAPEIVEGNLYFPPNSVNRDYLEESDHHTTCPWKGEASYAHVRVNGQTLENAAWFYPNPKDAASKIEGYVAFWKGVQVDR